MVEVQLDLERAVFEEFGGSRASYLVHLVGSDEGEGDVGSSVGKVETGLQSAEGDFAVTVGADPIGAVTGSAPPRASASG